MKKITYTFLPVEQCNMCKRSETSFKILGKRLNQSQGIKPSKKSGICTTIMQCKNCELIFPNPIPIPSHIEDHYGVPPENYWKDNYFKIDPNYFKEQIDTFFNLTNYDREQNLHTALDIGAGIGKCMISLNSNGFISYGIEPSSPFYKRAVSKMGISPDFIFNKSIEDAHFNSNHFDFITFGAVLEHFTNPSSSIKKALGWLKPGGLIHIEVPSSGWLTSKVVNFVYKIQGKDYVTNLSPMHAPYHLYEFSLKSFKENANEGNYEIAFHKYHVCNTYFPKFFDVPLKYLMKKNNSGMQLEIWLKKK